MDRSLEKGSIRSALYVLLNTHEGSTSQLLNFGLILIIFVASIISMCGTIKNLTPEQWQLLVGAEYVIAFIFSVEYALRLYAAPARLEYLFSLYGVIDLLAILPVFFIGMDGNSLALRIVRLLYVVRIIKIFRFWGDLMLLISAVKESIRLLAFVVGGVMVLAIIGGNLMYYVEPDNFDSAFDGVWWTLVTMSTVGYGDFVPHTGLGKLLAGVGMFIGIGIFAVITAIIGSKIQTITHHRHIRCSQCNDIIPVISQFCMHCGQSLSPQNEIVENALE